MKKLKDTDYPLFYKTYVDKVLENDCVEALKNRKKNTISFLESIPVDKSHFAYEKNKWTVNQLLIHVIDAERIFAYRALAFARGDRSELPGFSENDYAMHSNAEDRSLEGIINEYDSVRESTINLFASFDEKILDNIGNANGGNISVRALGTIICGHETHHLNVLKERYLV